MRTAASQASLSPWRFPGFSATPTRAWPASRSATLILWTWSPNARRRDVALESAGGHTTMSFEVNAFDALLAARTIRADLFTVGDQDLARPVYLSERGDTLVIVSVKVLTALKR